VGKRRKTEKVVDRKKMIWPGMGHWSLEVAPFFFFGSQSKGCGPRSWWHVAPSRHHHCHGTGKPHKAQLGRTRMVPLGCRAITHLVPSAPNLLGFPISGGAAVPLSLF
jgi:hypothetical protein